MRGTRASQEGGRSPVGTRPGETGGRRVVAAVAGLAIGLLVAVAVAATAAEPPAPDGSSIIARGAGTAPACATCHGATGQGNAAIGAPALAGDGAAYLREQLRNFASGQRVNPIMQPIAHALTQAERAAVAASFAAMPALAPRPVAVAADPLGALLARRGNWATGLPGCEQCHGPKGIGVGPHFPHLAGLTAPYITAQLAAFRAGTRPGGPLGLMGQVARKLSAPEIAAVAAYFGAESGAAGKQP